MFAERPILVPVLAVVAGCLMTSHGYLSPEFQFIPVALTAALVVIFQKKQRFYLCLLALFWFLWAFSAGSARMTSITARPLISVIANRPVVIEGVLVSRSRYGPDGMSFELNVERIDADRSYTAQGLRLQVTATGQEQGWLAGDRLRFPAVVHVPRMLGLPGEFDYPAYLGHKGIVAVARVSDARSVVLMRRTAATSSVLRVIDLFALKTHHFIADVVRDPDLSSVLLALATGEQHMLSTDLTAVYARAGVSHILSVSGFHVGVVTALWVLALRWLLVRWEWLALRVDLRRVTLLAALPVMVFYLFFTGCAPATARSVLMLAAVVLAVWSEREVELLDVLLAAALVLMLANPGILFDLSFQLSFMALWGVLVLTPRLVRPFEAFVTSKWGQAVLYLIATSIAASLATILPLLVHFRQASLIGIAANLLIVPLLGYGVTVLSTLAVPLIFVMPWVAAGVYKVCALIVEFCNYAVTILATLPVFTSYRFGGIDLLVAVILLAVISFVRPLRLRGSLLVLVLLALSVFHLWPDDKPDHTLRVTFLSVGQGDAALVQLPDGRTMLIDGGGYLTSRGKDFGERYLVPALHSLKVQQIDILVLTHAHPDHIGGLPAVAEQFRVGEFWQGTGSWSTPDYRRLMYALDRQGAKIKVVGRGDVLLNDQGVVVQVLSPLKQVAGLDPENDDSLVLRLRYGTQQILFMGDAGSSIEHELLKEFDVRSTVLKVGHHGSNSASSAAFLEAVQPKMAIISAGYNNRFKLPSDQVIDRLRRCGAMIYRTDLQGTLQLKSDGQLATLFMIVPDEKMYSFPDVLF